jgi:3-oxoadipate enol-lactonase
MVNQIKPGPFTTSLFANDILSVLDHLEVMAAHLVGCSMGGTVAMAFASQYADRVASLGLIDTTACYGEQAQASWEARGMQAYNQGLKSLTQFQLHRWFSESFVESNPDLVSRCLDIFVKNDPGVYLASCRMLGAADERHGLSSYQGACNVIVGAQDYATPLAMSQEIVNILPQSRLHVLEGVRHYSPIEAPEEVATILHSLWSEN